MCSLKTRNKEETERTSSMSCLCFSNRHTPEGHRRTGRDRGTGPPGGSATLTIYDEERHFRRPSTEVSQRFLFTGFTKDTLKKPPTLLDGPWGKVTFFSSLVNAPFSRFRESPTNSTDRDVSGCHGTGNPEDVPRPSPESHGRASGTNKRRVGGTSTRS